MAKIVMKQGSWGTWGAAVDGVDVGAFSMDQQKVLLMAVVKHLGIDVEYELFDGRVDRQYKVDEDGELRRVATEG
jgi:hypothetical protein